MAARGIVGKDVTPPCWSTSTTASDGASLTTNLALVRANAELAAQVAVALARMTRVVVVGDLAVDVLVTPTTAPVPGADVPARITTAPGGAGANTRGLAGRPGRRRHAGRPGRRRRRRPRGRRRPGGGRGGAAVAVDPDAPTATVVVLVGPGGERTMLSDRGAAARSRSPTCRRSTASTICTCRATCWAPGRAPPGSRRWRRRAAAGASTSVDPQATGVRGGAARQPRRRRPAAAQRGGAGGADRVAGAGGGRGAAGRRARRRRHGRAGGRELGRTATGCRTVRAGTPWTSSTPRAPATPSTRACSRRG